MAASETFRTPYLTVVVHPDRIELRKSAPNAKGWEVFIAASTHTIFLTSITNIEEEGIVSYLLSTDGAFGRTLVLHTADGARHSLNLGAGQLETVRDAILKRRADFLANQRLVPHAAAPQQPQSPSPAQPHCVTCSRCNTLIAARDLVTHLASCPDPQAGSAKQAAVPLQNSVPPLSCPWCGGDLKGRFEKCVNCGSTIAWADDGTAFKSVEEAQQHGLALQAHVQHVQRSDKIASAVQVMRSAITDAHLRLEEISQAEKELGQTIHDGTQWRLLSEKVDQALQAADALRAEFASLPDQVDPDQHRRLLHEFRVTYNELEDFRRIVAIEAGVSSERSMVVPGAEAQVTAAAQHAAPEHNEEKAIWQWMLTAAACVATADGKLGRAEMSAIAQAMTANGCPIPNDNLQTEVVDSCKRIHSEGPEKVAAALCEELRSKGKWKEAKLILQCLLGVSASDGSTGERELRLISYFTEHLTQ